MLDYLTRRRYSIIDLVIIYIFVQILDAILNWIF